MKLLVGAILALGMAGFMIYKRKVYGLKSTIIGTTICIIASIIFIGQFIGN